MIILNPAIEIMTADARSATYYRWLALISLIADVLALGMYGTNASGISFVGRAFVLASLYSVALLLFDKTAEAELAVKRSRYRWVNSAHLAAVSLAFYALVIAIPPGNLALVRTATLLSFSLESLIVWVVFYSQGSQRQ